MKEVRLGIIGCGNMGLGHMSYIEKVARLKFTAASDNRPEQLQKVKAQFPQVATFGDGGGLIKSGLVDAVLIAAPHYFHPPLAIAAMNQGLHVLCEKPVAVTAKAAAEVNALHRKKKHLVYGAMFQQRTVPIYRKLKEMIDGGELGQIRRVNWIATNWFRSQAYYNSGGWRATWAGEGGGVLLNQCPHNLDMLQWLVGVPRLIDARIGVGKYHQIEVEDEVNAYLEFANGATGSFITSTGEAPGTNRLEIVGDRGRAVTEGGKIEFLRTDLSVAEFCKTTPHSFPQIGLTKITIEPSDKASGHQGITENFVAAILDGTPLIAEAEEGIHSVELANAMIMSGLTGKPVPVPTDREAYDRLLKKMIKTSKFHKPKTVKAAQVDLGASFQK